MSIAYFTIPETGQIIYNGDTVILSEYPDIIAIASYGWYRYEETAMNGWHFILLPSKTAIPTYLINLPAIVVVSQYSDDGQAIVPICPTPKPPTPKPPKPDSCGIRDIESRAFITVDGLEQMQRLKTTFMPNGRIVRVNNRGDGKVGYYEWNVLKQSWDEWDLSGVGPTPIPDGVIQLKELGVVTSVDSDQFINPYIRYTFKAGKPLCDNLGIDENAACELYYSGGYQVVKITDKQDLFIRIVYQAAPSWSSSEWIASNDQQRLFELESDVEIIQSAVESHGTKLTDLESAIDTIKQNERLENVLHGAPRLSDEELNELLEARLNGEGATEISE